MFIRNGFRVRAVNVNQVEYYSNLLYLLGL